MANNYRLFNEIIPAVTKEERAWAQRLLGYEREWNADSGIKEMLKQNGVALDAVDLDDWPGFQWEITRPDSDLWLYGHECGNVLHAGEFVRAFLARFRPASRWSLTWAETCSKPRIGEFGGGGLFVTARSVKILHAAEWVARRQRAFDRRTQATRARAAPLSILPPHPV